MIKEGFLSELQKSIQSDINLEGMSQYLLFISAEDIIFSFDIMVFDLLNGSYHDLDPFTHSEAMNMAKELLDKNTNPDMINLEITDGMIKIRPRIQNFTGSTKGFLLMAKTSSDFILKPVYDKYFKEISIAKLTYNMFINPNASGLLQTDSNFLIYDDSNEMSLKVLKEFTRIFHAKKLIPKSKVPDYIIKEVHSRETIVDFITNDLEDTIVNFTNTMLDRFRKEIDEKRITVNKAVKNFKTMSVLSNVTFYNMQTMNSFDDSNKPEYNVGLAYLFDANLAKN